MSVDPLDIEPGYYDQDGAASALVEQQRADAINRLRTAPAVFLLFTDNDDRFYHWGFYKADAGTDTGDVGAFLGLAACRAVRDMADALDVTPDKALEVVAEALAGGAGADL